MTEKERTLWAGNLPDKLTEELFYELFLQFGPLEKVIIPQSKDGKPSAYGFVVFKHVESVSYAIKAMELVKIFGRKLNLKCRNNGNSHGSEVNRNSPNCHGSPNRNDRRVRESPSLGGWRHAADRSQNYNSHNQPQYQQGWFNQQTFMPTHHVDVASVRSRLQHSTRIMVDTQINRRDHRQYRERIYDRSHRR